MMRIIEFVFGRFASGRREGSNASRGCGDEQEKWNASGGKFFVAECERKLALSKVSYKTDVNTRTALRAFGAYMKGEDVPVEAMSAALIRDFERWLLDERGVSENTAALYLRSLRAIYNKVMKGHKHKDIFAGVRTTPCRAESIGAASIAEIRKVAAFKSPRAIVQLARDVFMFSFYCMGMPFVDVYHLRWSQIRGNVLTYCRRKTGIKVKVALTAEAKAIIERYKDRSNVFVFPLRQGSGQREYANALRCYNTHLKAIETALRLGIHLSSYVARHTWATLAYSETCDMNIVAGALGHSSTKVTKTYVSVVLNNKLLKTNRKIIRKLTQKNTMNNCTNTLTFLPSRVNKC